MAQRQTGLGQFRQVALGIGPFGSTNSLSKKGLCRQHLMSRSIWNYRSKQPLSARLGVCSDSLVV